MRRKVLSHRSHWRSASVQGAMLLVLLSGGACSTSTGPPTLAEYTIAGRVTEAGSPSVGIAGVLVSVNRAGPNYNFVTAVTDSLGAYSVTIAGCTTGSTLVLVSKYPEWEQQRHIIPCDQAELNVQLEPSSSSGINSQ